MIYGSVCSGIEAATVAWHPLGWRAAFYSEIEKFPRAVLQHHYPDVSLHGDFTTIEAGQYEPIDLLVGGTPCQSFSVAGLRGGLADDRGNLALEFLRLAQRLRPRWLVWENVPGVLSSNGGRDFGSILGGLVELGYGFAYRVLDAQHFGVPQRHRRVFVVGHLGDWRRAAAVLFERHSLSGNPPPRREAGKGFAAATAPSLTASGRGVERTGESRGQDPVVAHALNAKGGSGRIDGESETFVTHALRADGFDASEDGTGRGTPLTLAIRGRGDSHDLEWRQDGTANAILTPNGGRAGIGVGAIAHCFDARQSDVIQYGDKTGPLDTDPWTHAIAFAQNQRDEVREMNVAGALAGEPGMKQQTYVAFNITPSNSNKDYNARATERAQAITGGGNRPSARGGDLIAQPMSVRRLTPRECERLQGFPDDYTLIPFNGKPAADGPRYKALGNSMAVPVMHWIGHRIELIEQIRVAA